ncbi:MAG: DNA repair protein RecN [Anaerolineae bacterium]|nr:DNA repair protein RecN [Anaerolineae bacterium]
MLQELRIKDFAIIDDLTLPLDAGFLVMTGETGAGKSIIVDAVTLLLGDRADAAMIRAGADRTVVEGTFAVPAELQAALHAILQANELEGESPEGMILTREVRQNGRSQARVNGVACNLPVYREIGELLVDIHGQGEHLSLLDARQHLFLLDRYANLEAQRQAVGDMVRRLSHLRSEINSLVTDEEALARRVDMLQYQVQEIETANPRLDEETELQHERNRLVNAEKIADMANEAQFTLNGEPGETSAVDLLAQAAIVLSKLAKLDPAMTEHYQVAENISAQADDLAAALRDYSDAVEYDPHRLDEIEERVEVLNRLKRKHGGTIEAVLAYAGQARAELENITHSEERLAELREQEDHLLHDIGQAAAALSQERQRAAHHLTQAIVQELGDLKMEGARFEVAITHKEDASGCYVGEHRLAFGSTGIDQIEFMMAANVGELVLPLVKVASGGETSRIMLALKSVLAHADQTPTLIFDEIDQGIGGRMGSVVGHKLWELSGNHQVLVVTHLAQLAGFGDTHYRVSKHVRDQRTITYAERLNDQGRVEELSDMLGAETISARQSAYDILMLARRAKEGRWLETV